RPPPARDELRERRIVDANQARAAGETGGRARRDRATDLRRQRPLLGLGALRGSPCRATGTYREDGRRGRVVRRGLHQAPTAVRVRSAPLSRGSSWSSVVVSLALLSVFVLAMIVVRVLYTGSSDH